MVKLARPIHRQVGAWRSAMAQVPVTRSFGKVHRVTGMLIEARVPGTSVGELCEVFDPDQPGKIWRCEVVGFQGTQVLLSSLAPLDGISAGCLVRPLRTSHHVAVGAALQGRILDGFGLPLDGKPALLPGQDGVTLRKVNADAPPPVERWRIKDRFPTGVRSLDALATMGQGQRVGLFAGPGCGKTTLMAAVGRGSPADIVVVGLIGERGREVREFTEHEFPPDLMARTVMVCATSDRTSIERVRAAFTATAIAEGLRDQGFNVLLMIDSLTRLARAQREIGLSAGEAPARAGYPPSVYAMLPRLIERAGNAAGGSITALYTVLLEGELRSDPISEEAVSLLDGHIVLSRKLAEQGQYPAVDVLASLSRVMSNIVPREHSRAATRLRQVLSGYRDMELMVRLGEYRAGQDPETDRIVADYPKVVDFLRQDTRTPAPMDESIARMMALAGIAA
ncbi:ATP synthase in type III secretion protein N [Roseateles sp. YR242]|uniref:FliI/YscN family ATPase n=1 Tax=Roseateles sp. YR242 TaxID=1855305 RepID=UPI0008C7A416|nr:FliI/YscN family ATPase [Roseateles sp. YR242]SEK51515.1 ATP synthase in type III secretion protein N [Roseateles sp. YR242]